MQQKIENFDTPPPNYSLNEHATNGFSHRPSIAQIAAYIIIAFSIAVYLSSTVTLHNYIPLLALYIVFGVSMVVSSALATLVDPTDRVIYYYKWSRHDRKVVFAPEYDKILFCEFCDSYCWSNSKHCRTCNRCVNNFDHHCMWFNNCVGERNYKYFFTSIASTFCYTLTVVIHVALASFTVDYGESSQLIKIILSWIVALMLGIFGFLILNLIFLHIYLQATEQTTYQFLQRKKKEEEVQRKEKEKEQILKQNSIKDALSNHVLPLKVERSKQVELCSEESFANTKMVFVQNEKQSEPENAKTARRCNKRKISNDYFEGQIAKQSRKQEDQVTVRSNQEENEATINQQEPEQLNLEESREKLPEFLRKNRSIRLLLSSTNAENPSKKKLSPKSDPNN